MSSFDPTRIAAELEWLKKHPQFHERPATIREFVAPSYLNIEGLVRPAVMSELERIIGRRVRGDRITAVPKAMFTGAIGIGKTTVASVVLPYLVHWVLCLKDPQNFYQFLPGSRIAFMQMSTSEKQAKEVVFGDIKARIEYSPWFQNNYQFDPTFKNQLRFAKDIWILPGDSKETTFEGYNILGGILDEADSHLVTLNKDYAAEGYNTIHSRITSRFDDRGFILVIGQMKRANGFAARKYKEFKADPDAYAVKMTIWESFGWNKYLNSDGGRDSFWYNIKRHEIVPSGAAKMLHTTGKDNQLIEVPSAFKRDFINSPEKALRDLAGIPPATGSPFISLVDKIENCVTRWKNRYEGLTSPVKSNRGGYLPEFEDWFWAQDRLKRVIHLDMAYSADGDSLGFAMGHVPEMVEIEGERKPYIVFDCIFRVHAPAGREIFLGDIRRVVYQLRDDRKFKIVRATMDGFQSTDTRQQFNKNRIEAEIVSIDKQMLPYEDLREAIYDNRVDFPEYMVRFRENDVDLTEIAVKELMELVDADKKVDHPEGGSKDIADAMAGVVYTLVGDRTYHRKNLASLIPENASQQGPMPLYEPGRSMGLPDATRAPVPPIGVPWRPPTRRAP